jgi:hypothetical protein
MGITLRPADGFNAEIATDQEPQVLSEADTIALMENGKAAGYSFRVELKAYGYRLNFDIEKKAIELAGLESFEAAQQTAKGYIEF